MINKELEIKDEIYVDYETRRVLDRIDQLVNDFEKFGKGFNENIQLLRICRDIILTKHQELHYNRRIIDLYNQEVVREIYIKDHFGMTSNEMDSLRAIK